MNPRTRYVMIALAAKALDTYGCEEAADLILDAAPKSALPDEPAVSPHTKVEWIKWHRQRFGTTLKAAKDAADAKWAAHGL